MTELTAEELKQARLEFEQFGRDGGLDESFFNKDYKGRYIKNGLECTWTGWKAAITNEKNKPNNHVMF